MKGIMITAPKSGSGKTMVTIGIIRALLNMGFDVCGFKTGPDYIDTAFIKEASK
ncbi:MAG TPA: cobyrinate a,c-diamide synthase, partial [Clostridiaceae bacterium]|nr:cobyrinate a,c-diamide synthase [Clostridiaceae bacterium]